MDGIEYNHPRVSTAGDEKIRIKPFVNILFNIEEKKNEHEDE